MIFQLPHSSVPYRLQTISFVQMTIGFYLFDIHPRWRVKCPATFRTWLVGMIEERYKLVLSIRKVGSYVQYYW